MSSNAMGMSVWRSSTATWTMNPIFPALNQTAWRACAERSKVVVKNFFMPMGEHPPWIYPVRGRSCFDLIISTDFSPTAAAAFLRSREAHAGTTKT